MRSRLMLLIAATISLLVIGLTASAPKASAALFDSAKNDACNGIALDSGTAGCDPKGAGKVNNILSLALNLFSIVVGVTAVIMVMLGGFKYITSQGDSTAIANARNTILYAIIGLVIVAFAQIFVHFVLNKTR